MGRLKAYKSPRHRDEFNRTFYSTSDRRIKAATFRMVMYSDGRKFSSIQIHNMAAWKELEVNMQRIQNKFFP